MAEYSPKGQTTIHTTLQKKILIQKGKIHYKYFHLKTLLFQDLFKKKIDLLPESVPLVLTWVKGLATVSPYF